MARLETSTAVERRLCFIECSLIFWLYYKKESQESGIGIPSYKKSVGSISTLVGWVERIIIEDPRFKKNTSAVQVPTIAKI